MGSKEGDGAGGIMDLRNLLAEKGVRMPDPGSVFIGPGVDPDRIAPGAVIHPGCRVTGPRTLLMEGAEVGEEAPATISDCLLGPGVRLKGGFFERAVFLDGASMGSSAHVRAGTILEERASGAHAVGLKHTILFPFVTLGSLVNFCDVLMAGGTSHENHSEVGSSYIHFNYTPQQDKATASLLGDVPSGVTLRENSIFLGGQGGLVGPVVLAFGTVIAAGSIWRRDQPKRDRLVFDGSGKRGEMAHVPGHYKSVKRIVANNVEYIGNLIALLHWYGNVRSRFIRGPLDQALHQGLVENCVDAIHERVSRFRQFCGKMKRSLEIQESLAGGADSSTSGAILKAQKTQLLEKRDELAEVFSRFTDHPGETGGGEAFLGALDRVRDGRDYLSAIRSLSHEDAQLATLWLSAVVSGVRGRVFEMLPTLRD